MRPCLPRGHSAAGRACEHARSDQEGLADLLDGRGFFADGNGERGDPNRAAAEAAGECPEHRAVEPVQAQFVAGAVGSSPLDQPIRSGPPRSIGQADARASSLISPAARGLLQSR